MDFSGWMRTSKKGRVPSKEGCSMVYMRSSVRELRVSGGSVQVFKAVSSTSATLISASSTTSGEPMVPPLFCE